MQLSSPEHFSRFIESYKTKLITSKVAKHMTIAAATPSQKLYPISEICMKSFVEFGTDPMLSEFLPP